MIPRSAFLEKIKKSILTYPVTALIGSRQSGKTTLAKEIAQQFSQEGQQVTFFDLEEAGFDVVSGDDSVAGFGDALDFPAEGMGDEGEGFFQAGVAGLASFETAAKFGGWQAAADLALERFTTGGGIDDTLNVNGVDAATDAGEADRKEIHDETGIDAGTDDARAGFSAELIETFRQGGFAQGREEEFLARGDDADAKASDWFDL